MPEQKNEVFLVRTPQPPVAELSDEQEDEQQLTEEASTEEIVVEESPTEEANGDDLDDLFKAPSREDPDMRVDDLVSVSEEDVFGEGGEDMSDLVDVSAEDIMGEDLVEPTPPPKPKRVVVRRIKRTGRQYPPQPSIGGLRY